MTVRLERNEHVTTVIHSRPEARNAMDPESADALVDAFLAFEADDEAHVAVLWGEGGAFCAGWDLKYVASLSPDKLERELAFPEQQRSDASSVPRGPLGPTRLALSKPVIAAVAGPAVAGGMELALWCDIRIMEEDAYLGVYCRRWGMVGPYGCRAWWDGDGTGRGRACRAEWCGSKASAPTGLRAPRRSALQHG